MYLVIKSSEYIAPNTVNTGNLGNEALIVTRDDEVFALGSNGAGCLGLGDMHSTLAPKQVEPLCYKVSLIEFVKSIINY